jgi:hypothetical protein
MEMTYETAAELLEQIIDENPLFARVLDKTILAREIPFHGTEADRAAATGDIDKQRLHQNLVEFFKQQLSEIK